MFEELKDIFSRFRNGFKRTTEASAIKDPKALMVKRIGVGLFKSSSEKNNWAAPEVDLEQIENAYLTDSYIRTSVDKHVDYMFKSGWTLRSKNPSALEYIEARLKIMELATGQTFESLINEMAECEIKYHNIFQAKARKSGYPFPSGIKVQPLMGGNPVVGYYVLPPMSMEITRDNTGSVKKYRQRVQGEKEIEFKPEDMIHITVDKPPGRAFGMPYLWEALDDVKILRQLEELVDRMIYKNIFPLITYQVGLPQEGMTAEDEEIEEVKAMLGELELDSGIVLPERHNIAAVKVDPMDIRPYLDYFEQRVFTGLGVSGVLMGRGATANRSTSDTLDATFRDRIKGYQRTLATHITTFMFQELLQEGGFDPIMNKDDEVHFVFREIDFDSKIKEENHAIQKFTQNATSHEELRLELGLEPLTDVSGLYFNMITGTLAAQAAQQKVDSANNQGDNKNQPANQSGKKTSPGKGKENLEESTEYSSEKVTKQVLEACWSLMKESFMVSKNIESINFYKLSMDIERKRMSEVSYSQLRVKIQDGFEEAYKHTGIVVPKEEIANTIVTEQMTGRIERYYDRLCNKELLPKIQTILKETNDTQERNKRIANLMDSLEYRVTSIIRTESARARNLGFLYGAKKMGKKEIKINGEANCGICAEHVGKTISVDSKELPPFHTNCNCYLSLR